MSTIASSDLDFFGDDVIADPIPVYAKLRDLGRVVWLEKHNAWLFSHYDEVTAALRQPDIFISGKGLSLNDDVNAFLIGSTLNSDGERHDRTRAITAFPINRKNVQALEPFIKNAAEGLAETLTARGTFDAVGDLATFLPLSIVVELVGLSGSTSKDMLRWAAATFNLFEGFNDRSKAAFADLVDLRRYLEEYGRREKLKEGGLAHRIFVEGPEQGFSEEECAQLMRDYVNPSLDTTISATGFAAYYFATNPDQWDKLRADPSLVPNAIEEIVRLSTPIRAFTRYTASDTEVAGVPIKKGDRVIVSYASANRDPSVFENPDAFDVTRNVRKHLGFGHGRHLCMGLHLARLEMAALLNAFLGRVSRWELTGEGDRAMNNIIHAFEKLPVRVTPL